MPESEVTAGKETFAFAVVSNVSQRFCKNSVMRNMSRHEVVNAAHAKEEVYWAESCIYEFFVATHCCHVSKMSNRRRMSSTLG